MTSGARLPKFEPPALDAEQRALYNAIAGGRRAQGPQLFMAGKLKISGDLMFATRVTGFFETPKA